MVRRKILYILILVAAAWLVLLYTFQGLRFLLVILLCVPIVCLISLLFQIKGTCVETEEFPASVTRGEDIRLHVSVTYRGKLPLAGVRIQAVWSVYGERPVKIKKMLHGVAGNGRRTIEFELTAAHCGPGRFTVAKARIYDCLGLFSVPVGKSAGIKVMIAPVISPLPENEAAFFRQLLRTQAAGNDGDYFVREYRPGDSPRSIHWKLTAKEDEMQVKDFEPDDSLKIFLHMTDELLADWEKRDAFLDKACSLMVFLAENCRAGAEILWMQEGVLCSSTILEIKDVYPCIGELLSVRSTGAAEGMDGGVLQLMEGCHLEEDGRLYKGWTTSSSGEQCAYE